MYQRKFATTDHVRSKHEQLALRSSPRLTLGRATSGASALALAFAFLAPKAAHAVPFFEDLTTTKVPAADPSCAISSKAGCYTSWLAITDLDSDGDMDVVFANGGGYYKPDFANATTAVPIPPPSNEPSTVYLNDGLGNFTDVTGPAFGGATSRLRQVGVGDVNGDGLKDVYQPGGYAKDLDKLWIQTAPGVFENRAATLLPAGVRSNAPAFHMGDLDGDGDLDIVTTDWATALANTPVFLSLYLNDGSGKFTLVENQKDANTWTKSDYFPPQIPGSNAYGTPYFGSRAIDLDFADIDNDFDLDILVDMRNGISRILLNDGTAHFTDGNGKVTSSQDKVTGVVTTVSNYPMKRGPYVYNQELCDFDNDGDLDMLLDNAGAKPTPTSSGFYTQVLVNDGKGVFTDQTRDRIFGELGSDDNGVKCVDLNNDGNYDLLVASLTGASEKLLLADGTGKFNAVLDAFPKITDATLAIDSADFDGDGLFDVWTGQGEGGLFQNRFYHGVAALDGTGAKVDTRPPTFRAIETPVAVEGKPIVVRFAVRDAITSETGDMVKNVAVTYFTTEGVSGKVDAKFIGGDLFRAVIPPQVAYTTVTLSPQALDRKGLKGIGAPVAFVVKKAGDIGSGGAGGTGGTGAGGMSMGGGTSMGGTGGMSMGGTGGLPMGDAGTAGEEPAEAGAAGTPSEPGTAGGSSAGSSAGGGSPSEAGAAGDPGTAGTAGTPGVSDDDGCSVSTTGTSSSGAGWLAAVGLALVAGLRRRKNGAA